MSIRQKAGPLFDQRVEIHNEGAVALPANGSWLTADFGYQNSAGVGSIGDMVFYDVNANGVYDAGTDSPLPNVSVNLFASDGTTLLATTKSDSNGLYTFGGRPAGTYVVKVDLTDTDIPANLACSVSGGAYSAFALSGGQAITDKDFPFSSGLSKTVDKSTAVSGDLLNFTLRPNYPSSVLLTNATVTDPVPTGTTFASAGQGGTNSGGTVTWNLGSTTAASNGTKTLSTGSGAAIAQRGTPTTGTAGKNSTTITINKPTGVVAGDVMIANIQLRKGTVTLYPTLSGWTPIDSVNFENSGADHRCEVLYRVAGASEGSSYTFNLAGGTQTDGAVGGIVAYSGVDNTTPLDATGDYSIGSSKTISTGAITTVSPNAAVLMCVGAFESLTVGSFATTSPGALTTLYGGSSDGNGTVGAGWALKASAGSTGAGTATLSGNKVWGAILLALKPGSQSYTATTALSADHSVVTSGETVTVTLTATATGNAGTVTAGALTATGTNGASAVCSAASPLTTTVNNGSATFTYTCTLSSGTTPGVLTFQATPTDSNGTWAQGTANTVIVTPPLTFGATVNTNPGVSAVLNTGYLKNNSGATTLTPSPTTTTTLLGSIGDYVWWDNNHNGLQDEAPATPIEGAVVLLYVDANNNGILDVANGDYQIASTLTGADGKYLFNNLPAGRYIVNVYEDSIISGGIRNVVPTTSEDVYKNLAGGETYLGADFGFYVGALVEGTVFHDTNSNAVMDPGESGLSPVTVTLTGTDEHGGAVNLSTPTDASGYYKFLVAGGNYTVSYNTSQTSAMGYPRPTTAVSYTFVAAVGEDGHNVYDFGVGNNGSVGDTVFDDANGNGIQDAGEAGLANVTVGLYADSAFTQLLYVKATDASGHYLFSGLPDGTYYVMVNSNTLPSGYNTTPTADPDATKDGKGTAVVTSGGNVLTMDFGYKPVPTTFSVSGYVWNDNGAGGGTVGDGIKNGTEPGIAGVAVTITVAGVPYVVVTDATGFYTLAGVPSAATVVITVNTGTLPNKAYVQTGDPDGVKDNTTTFTMPASAVSNKNFGYREVLATLSGTVVRNANGNGLADAGETVVPGVSISLRYAGADGIPGTADDVVTGATTDGSGNYSFASLKPGFYQITKTNPTGYYGQADRDGGNPDVIELTIAAGNPVTGVADNKTHQDFEITHASLGDYVWFDVNGNGVQDAGEPPLAGVRVFVDSNGNGSFDAGEPSALTSAAGTYTIPDLAPGSCSVRVDTTTLPAGLSPSFDFDGIGSPNVATVTLAANQNRTDVDWGYQGNATVTGHLYIDTNGNHTQDAGEPNLADVNVVVTDSLGGSRTVSSNASGNWSATVPAGSVTANVDETDPQFPHGAIQTQGTDPTTVTAVANTTTSAGINGYFIPGSITGTVLADTNNDSLGDTPISGVTLTLKDSNGNDIDSDAITPGIQPTTTTTAANGSYSFGGLPPATYQVVETDPVGYTSVTPNLVSVVLAAGGTGVANFVDTQLVDLAIVKTVDHPTPLVGSNVVFTLTVTNNGPAAATGVSVTDLLPNGYTFVSAIPLGAYNSLTGVWTIGSLANGANASLQITAKVNATGTYLNTASVSGAEQDPNLANNTSSASTTPVAQTDLAIVKTVDHPTPLVGTNVMFTLTATNHGPSAATNVSVSDVLPNGYTFVSANPALAYNAGTGIWTIGNLANGANASLQITAKVNATGTYLNTATVTGAEQDPDFANNISSASTVPIPLSSIGGVVLEDTDNNSTGDTPIPGVTITLRDSNGIDIDSDPISPGVQATTTITANDGSYLFSGMPPGTYQVVETDPVGFTSLTSNELLVIVSNGSTGIANFVDTRLADLEITKTVNTTSPRVGSPVTFTLTVTNNGPAHASGVVVNDLLPSGYQFVSANPPAAYNAVTGVWTIGNLALHASIALQITANVNVSGDYLNVATVTGSQPDPDLHNNTAERATTPVPQADLEITKTVDNATPLVGTNVLFTLTATNHGPSNATGIFVADALPSGYTFVSAEPAASPYNDGFFWMLASLANGASAEFKITAKVEGAGGYLNVATISGDQEDSKQGNNRAEQATDPIALGSISGTVLADTNHDGLGDVGIPGVTLTLKDSSGNDIDSDPLAAGIQATTTTTVDDGSYSFPSLPAGTYQVVETDLPGYLSVTPNTVSPVGVESGIPTTDVNFVDEQTGSISGFVLADTDNNGSGDAPLAGVTVTLEDAAGNPIDGNPNIIGVQPVTAITAADGSYAFAGLAPGTYGVRETQPAGYGSVSDSDGGDPNEIRPLVVSAGTANAGNDFIDIQFGSIAGSVRKDTDGNGSGDSPLAGVTLTLLNGSGIAVDGDPNTPGIQPVTAVTALNGSYHFANLYPGFYQISETQPAGYVSVSDVDGGNPDLIGDVIPLGVAPGQNVTGRDFVEMELANISGYVRAGTNPIVGVIIHLLDKDGNPVDGDPITPGMQPMTAVTDDTGHYFFRGVVPGIYQIKEIQPSGYVSVGDSDGGDPDLIGLTVLPGQSSENNDFLEAQLTCPDTWAKWKLMHPGQTADGNPDGDAYDNLAEFAFAMPYDSGANNAWVIQPSVAEPGTLEAVFVRPKHATDNVTYTLQYAADLDAPPAGWGEIPITLIPDVITAVDNLDCTETVTIHDLEQTTGLTNGQGVVRIKVVLHEGPPSGLVHTSRTETEGWKQTGIGPGSQTYNVSYLREAVFSGTVSAVKGQDLTFATSTGGVDLSTVLDPGFSYYLEVSTGHNEGHRFDIVSATGDTVTLAAATSLDPDSPPFCTLTGAPPASLAGDRVVIRRHWTLDEICPPVGFGGADVQDIADEVEVFADGHWSIYWLYDLDYEDNIPARWVNAADAGKTNAGATVIPPGQGIFINSRSISIITTVAGPRISLPDDPSAVLSYGEVRANDFIRPLAVGYNLVGGGFPLTQSATGASPGDVGRAMDLAAGFSGSLDFKTADSFFTWNGDTMIDGVGNPAIGYSTYFLLDWPPDPAEWAQVGDPDLNPFDAKLLFLGNRSAFIRTKNGVSAYRIPLPWAP